jgi:methylthioribose-1-phosphate isomerase
VALRFEDGVLWALDQTRLPWDEVELALRSAAEVADAITALSIRGAPLIGVAAGYGLALELTRSGADALEPARTRLLGARPTAVNLAHAVTRVAAAARAAPDGAAADAALAAARALHEEEIAASEALGRVGADFLTGVAEAGVAGAEVGGAGARAGVAGAGARAGVAGAGVAGADARPGGLRILTHCNTGALAAPGRGTALSVVAELADRGALALVLTAETRPLLQGARLTVYELRRLGIDHELIVDGAAAGLIAAGEVDAIVLGCDRVAANGDVANKVGTYAHALAAAAAGIPFVVAGPCSTIDPGCRSGAEIVIEQRSADEVTRVGQAFAANPLDVTLAGTPCRNPAFDVTPAALVTALVTEAGVVRPSAGESVLSLLSPRSPESPPPLSSPPSPPSPQSPPSPPSPPSARSLLSPPSPPPDHGSLAEPETPAGRQSELAAERPPDVQPPDMRP